MNKKIMLFGILIILPTIFLAMERDAAIKHEDPAVVVAWCKNKLRNKDYQDRFFYEYTPEMGHLFGIADGHCGSRTSAFIAKNLGSKVIIATPECTMRDISDVSENVSYGCSNAS